MRVIVKKIIWAVVGILLFLLIWNWSLVVYGIRQGKGQLNIIWNTVPLDSILKSNTYPDSLKKNILLVKEIKQFCLDSLGLEVGDNYQNLYDQKGKPVLWVVTGSPKFSLESYQWKFPILGEVSYKGFFNLELAKAEENKLKQLNFDTDLDEVNAWSTLGWFKDPIMSSMLEYSEGQLARTLIHEITHFNLYVKSDVDYNENLATFIGDKGAERFLKFRFGITSKELNEYHTFLSDIELFSRFMVKTSKSLQDFYILMPENLNDKQKTKLKSKKLNDIIGDLKQLPYQNPNRIKKIMAKQKEINNTFFTDFLMYRKSTVSMEKDFVKNYKSDIKLYIQSQKNKYGK